MVALIGVAAFAQDAPPTANAPVLNASVSGVVRDKRTGKPLEGYSVSTYVGATWIANAIQMSSTTKPVQSITDASGRYRIADLPATPYRITARDSKGGFGAEVTKHVVLSGHDLEINFDVAVTGAIKGKVVDENKEPLSGITVILISREYFLGQQGYFFRGAGRTNDRGEYKIENVPTGQPFFLMAERRMNNLQAHSEAPLNPKLRRRIPMRTWYPSSPSKDGAAPVLLQSGETRDAVNIEMKKSANYCISGTLLTAGGPGPLNFMIEPQQPSSGVHEGGGMYMVSGNGKANDDGEIRVCDLSPGSYRIEASQHAGPLLFGTAVVAIGDEDIRGVKVVAMPGQDVPGEVVLDGPVPLTPLATKVRVSLEPLLRSRRQGEGNLGASAAIPDTFNLAGIITDDYMVRTNINGPGLYLKDVQWSGISILYQPLRLGTASGGSGLRILVGQDGGTISTVVTTKDGNPAPDVRVVAFPAYVAAEGSLSAAMVAGQTDQTGSWKSQPLAPGKWFVGAVDGSIDYTTEVIARLWRSRPRFTEVDLGPNGTPQIALEPVTLAP
jgi:hypothetical protein